MFIAGLIVAYAVALLATNVLPASTASAINLKNTTGGFGHSLPRFNEAKEVRDVDVLFIGSSHAYRGFDTRVFEDNGVSAFNLGSSNQTPINSLNILRKYDDNITPKRLVIEVYWGALRNGDGNESTIDISSNTNVNFDIARMAVTTRTVEGINSTFANLLLQTFDTQRLDNSRQQDITLDTYIPGGFVETVRMQRRELDFPEFEVRYSDKQIEHLEQIITSAQNNGIEVTLVRTPVSRELVESITNFDEMTDEIDMIADRHAIDFLDFNREEVLDDLDLSLGVHFYDRDHLTQAGVEIFNDSLFQQMEQLGYFE